MTSQLDSLTGVESVQAALIQSLQQASREVSIRSQTLAYLNSQELAAALLEFARPTGTKIRLLLDGTVSRIDHQLLLAARRLPSRIELRRCSPEYSKTDQEYWLFDCRSMIRWRADSLQGHWYRAPAEVKATWDEFLLAWDKSETDLEYRQMRL